MAIQYAGGTIVNATFNSDGTRLQLVNQLNTALKTAGWSVISGDGTADVLMKTAVTPQGLSICFRLYDPGAGNCAQFTMRSQAGDKVSQIGYMLPTLNKQFRIIANKHQFFMFSTGADSGVNKIARTAFMGGTIWVPDFIQSTLGNVEIGWMYLNGISDTDTANNHDNFRTVLSTQENCGYSYATVLWNSTLTNYSNSYGGPSLICPQWGWAVGSVGVCWKDGSGIVQDAVVGWSDASNNGHPLMRGQLWDALVLWSPYTSESIIPWDGGSSLAVTDSCDRGTLFIKVA